MYWFFHRLKPKLEFCYTEVLICYTEVFARKLIEKIEMNKNSEHFQFEKIKLF